MIIFGTRGLESVSGTGSFNCPRCGMEKPFLHKAVKKWFTLYFIPVIPLGTAGTYVECGNCGGTYDENVFSYNPESEMREQVTRLKGVLILAMLDDGRTDPSEMQALRDSYHEITDESLKEEELDSDIQMVREAGIDLDTFARQVGENLSFNGKALVVKGVFRILSANGHLRQDGEAVMGRLATAFELSSDQIRKIIAEPA